MARSGGRVSRAQFKGATSGRRDKVLRAIAGAVELTQGETLILYAVEAHVGYADRETGRSWPSVATLGRAARVSERTAFRLIAQLRASGWLRVEKRTQRGAQASSWYTVTPPERVAAVAVAEPEDDAPPLH